MMKNFAVVLLIAMTILNSVPAQAEENNAPDPIVVVGNFTQTGDSEYNMVYTVVDAGDLRVQLNQLSFGLTQVWLNGPSISLLKRDGLSLAVRPGVLVGSDGRVYAGGFVDLDVAERLHIHYRGCAGQAGAKHVVYTTLQVTPEVGLQHYYFATEGVTDSYVGPTVKFGDLSLWGGASTNRPGSWAVDASLQVRF